MKITTFICFFAFLLSLTAIAEDKLIKSCATTLKIPENPRIVESQIDILKSGSSYRAITKQKIDGQVAPELEEEVQIDEFKVQPGLKADLTNIDSLNLGEKLIVHALLLSSDPAMEGTFNTGLDLKKVRSATVYTVGEATGMGLVAIVEAKDENGKMLGSFLGGFLVAPCKEAPPKIDKKLSENDLSNCTRDLSNEVICPEGVYKFVSGKAGNKINESLRGSSKENEPTQYESKRVILPKAKSK